MIKSIFDIPQMDCPCEEQMIRMKLQEQKGIASLSFDLTARRLEVIHSDDVAPIDAALASLDLGSRFVSSVPFVGTLEHCAEEAKADEYRQRSRLWWVLSINFALFLFEVLWGVFAQSMGLVADSLDMLADAFVYGLALLAIGRSISTKKSVTFLSGIVQLVLALWGIYEVIHRFIVPSEVPNFWMMIAVSIVALVGNTASLMILRKEKSRESHLEAARIFTSNDIIVNIGVIVSAIVVAITSSSYPDLIVGSVVFLLVLRGAIRILRLAR